jgi:toxin ParE1/3/4
VRYKVTFSPSAVADVDDIYAWTGAHFGLMQAEKYLELIELSVDEIAVRPDGPLTRRHPGMHPDARTLHLARTGLHAKHFLLFRHTEDGEIEVGRLLHDAMDLAEHLPEEYRA